MAIKVIKPGLSTTVQDLGRPGYYHIGIPISGGMDRFALCAANWLVGNKEDAAVLEATFQGPELEFRRVLFRSRNRNADMIIAGPAEILHRRRKTGLDDFNGHKALPSA